ncbi:MAG TPA: DUF4405 domain-containing protein, partial [Desulfobulbaceae bacterium]|nr:DUF4405 domain-containing protein [Desulfobulbaceae bacterium]
MSLSPEQVQSPWQGPFRTGKKEPDNPCGSNKKDSRWRGKRLYCDPVMTGIKEKIREKIIRNRWGGQTLVSLYISVLSGIVLALQYNPAEPFYSTATLELVVPYGAFWRALHYYSSQAFFLLLLCHLAVIIYQTDTSFHRIPWIRLTASVPVAILLLFTGYVLRGDATGEAAGAIAEHIALSIPI